MNTGWRVLAGAETFAKKFSVGSTDQTTAREIGWSGSTSRALFFPIGTWRFRVDLQLQRDLQRARRRTARRLQSPRWAWLCEAPSANRLTLASSRLRFGLPTQTRISPRACFQTSVWCEPGNSPLLDHVNRKIQRCAGHLYAAWCFDLPGAGVVKYAAAGTRLANTAGNADAQRMLRRFKAVAPVSRFALNGAV